MHSTRFATKKAPILKCFTKDPGFAHVNAVRGHRYHHEEHRANRFPNLGPTVDVNMYIAQCALNGMLEGTLHPAIVNESRTGYRATGVGEERLVSETGFDSAFLQ